MLADHTQAGYLSMSWKTHLWSNLWLYCGLDARVSWEKPACGVIKVNNRRSLRVSSAPVWGQIIGPHIILQSSHSSSLLLASRPSPNTLLADKPDFVFAKGRRRDFCSTDFKRYVSDSECVTRRSIWGRGCWRGSLVREIQYVHLVKHWSNDEQTKENSMSNLTSKSMFHCQSLHVHYNWNTSPNVRTCLTSNSWIINNMEWIQYIPARMRRMY